MLPALHEHVAAARVDAVLNHCHFAARLFARRVFGAIDKTAQVAIFHPAKTVGFLFDFQRVAERLQRRLGHGEIHIVTQRENVDQHVMLRRGREPFTERRKVFQLRCAVILRQRPPKGVAERHDNAKIRLGKLRLKGRDFIGENFTRRAQRLTLAFLNARLKPDSRTTMLRQNAALNHRHHSS